MVGGIEMILSQQNVPLPIFSSVILALTFLWANSNKLRILHEWLDDAKWILTVIGSYLENHLSLAFLPEI